MKKIRYVRVCETELDKEFINNLNQHILNDFLLCSSDKKYYFDKEGNKYPIENLILNQNDVINYIENNFDEKTNCECYDEFGDFIFCTFDSIQDFLFNKVQFWKDTLTDYEDISCYCNKSEAN